MGQKKEALLPSPQSNEMPDGSENEEERQTYSRSLRRRDVKDALSILRQASARLYFLAMREIAEALLHREREEPLQFLLGENSCHKSK